MHRLTELMVSILCLHFLDCLLLIGELMPGELSVVSLVTQPSNMSPELLLSPSAFKFVKYLMQWRLIATRSQINFLWMGAWLKVMFYFNFRLIFWELKFINPASRRWIEYSMVVMNVSVKVSSVSYLDSTITFRASIVCIRSYFIIGSPLFEIAMCATNL